VTTTAEEALAVVGLKPVAMPQLKAPFEPVQCAQFDRYDGHCRAVRIGLFGSRYSEISTVPTLLNRLAAMSFGTTWPSTPQYGRRLLRCGIPIRSISAASRLALTI